MTKNQQEEINTQWCAVDNAIGELDKIKATKPEEARKLGEAVGLMCRAKDILAELSPNV